jgi:hypothetical protein
VYFIFCLFIFLAVPCSNYPNISLPHSLTVYLYNFLPFPLLIFLSLSLSISPSANFPYVTMSLSPYYSLHFIHCITISIYL